MSSFTAEQLEQPFYSRHRGPFRLVVHRPDTKAKVHRTEWVKGEMEGDDVESEALALLADPRDTITSVDVWSVSEQIFVFGYPDVRSIEV